MEWFIPGNVPSSKNGRRWTGKYFIASKSVMNYRKETKKYYEEYAQEFRDALKNAKPPIHIQFTFIRGSKHKFADCLLPVFSQYSYSKENPGVKIKILYGETFNKPNDE